MAGRYDQSLQQYAKVAALTPDRFEAQYELGWMLAFVRRYAEAVAPLEHAARLRPAHTGVHRALTIAFAMLRRPSQALHAALAGARLGDRIAMFDVARHYRNGLGVNRDPRKALLWLTRAAKAGHVKAMDDLVQVYLNGELGEAPDDAKAERWATEARRARTR
jgi:TPR repeat protein